MVVGLFLGPGGKPVENTTRPQMLDRRLVRTAPSCEVDHRMATSDEVTTQVKHEGLGTTVTTESGGVERIVCECNEERTQC